MQSVTSIKSAVYFLSGFESPHLLQGGNLTWTSGIVGHSDRLHGVRGHSDRLQGGLGLLCQATWGKKGL